MKKKKPEALGAAVLVATAAILIVLFIGKFSLLTIILAALNCLTALLIFIYVLRRDRLPLHLTLAFFTGLVGITLFYAFYGVEDILSNLTKNLIIAAPCLGVALLLIVFCIKIKKAWQKIVGLVLSAALVGTGVLYVLTMNLKMKPDVESLQEGHERYLNSLESMSSDGPNVLFILADDMGYSDISAFRYTEDCIIETPNIDAIGENGVVLENFYSASPVCSPSRFACMTGRYPSRGYADNVWFPTIESLSPFTSTRYYNPFEFVKGVDGILPDEITVAEALQRLGYQTGAFGKWHLGDYGDYLPNKNGFDYFYGSPLVNDMVPYEFYRNEEKVISHEEMDQTKITGLLTDEINSFITSKVNSKEKFFTYYATPWPHYPVHASEEYAGKSDAGTYGDCIEELDDSVGSIINNLKQLGVYDNTLIIFTSDNGPGREGATGAYRGRKNTTFEGGQKVPFLACWTNGLTPRAERITARTMNIDLFPTLLAAAGVTEMPSDRVIDGVNLLPLLKGETASDAVVHDALFYLKRGKVQAVQMPVEIDGEIKDLKYYKSVRSENSAFIDQVYKNYLFDLDTDPAEAYNVSMTYKDEAALLAKRLEEFKKELKNNRRGIK